MSTYECIDRLGGWKGYRVSAVERFEPSAPDTRARVWIALELLPGRRLRCGVCGNAADTVHDVVERWVRELPLFDADTWLKVGPRLGSVRRSLSTRPD